MSRLEPSLRGQSERSPAQALTFTTPEGDVPMDVALREPDLRAALLRTLAAPQHEDGWILEERPLNGFEAWKIQVKVAQMPDGSSAITGLRMEPREDFEGSLFNQRITSATLRRIPLTLLQHEAAQWIALLVAADPQSWFASMLDTHQAQKDHVHELLAEETQHQHDQRAKEVGMQFTELEEVAREYLRAQSDNVRAVRKRVAQRLGVCERTVDRRVRKAREAGLLPKYHGRQGKYGTKEPKKGREGND